MTSSQIVQIPPTANRIFVFDEVYPSRAAEEQAGRKKLNAFGVFAKINFLNRPKEETVLLSRKEMRLEPFWKITALRSIDYDCQVIYSVPVHNPYAYNVMVHGESSEVARQGGKAKIEIQVGEQCHRKISYDGFIDGLGRKIKQDDFENYVAKYKYSEFESIDRPETVTPLVSQTSAMQAATSMLNGEAINAHDIRVDELIFEKVHLYLRPVFAFEFRWASADKTGVIEVDGLTGEVIENGQWFKDKIGQIMTRDMLIEIGSQMANAFVPGSGAAVKVIGRMTE